jgi:hypothetical protein
MSSKPPEIPKVAPLVWITVIFAITVIVFTCFAEVIRGRGKIFEADDPVGYYVYLRSAVHDHDLDFRNDFALCLGQTEKSAGRTGNSASDTGKPDNNFTVGMPLLVAPAYIAGNLIFAKRYTSLDPKDFPLFLDQLIFSYGNLVLGFLGIWLSFKFVSAYLPERDSLIATVAFWLCSPLLYYFGREPFMSHLASLFAASLLLYVWKVPALSTTSRSLIMGMIAGVLMMVRQQDILIVLIPAGSAFLDPALRGRRKQLIPPAVFFGLGFLATFAVQMFVWRDLRGSFITFAYKGQSFDHLLSPQFASVLFSSNHGLLSWHPIVALCVIGWFQLRRENGSLSVLALTCFALQLYVIASWWSWWMGYSFGNRGFLGLTPLFILGLGTFYTRLEKQWARRLFAGTVGTLFLWNVTMMLAYVSEMIPYEGTFSWRALILALPRLPAHILAKAYHL